MVPWAQEGMTYKLKKKYESKKHVLKVEILNLGSLFLSEAEQTWRQKSDMKMTSKVTQLSNGWKKHNNDNSLYFCFIDANKALQPAGNTPWPGLSLLKFIF